MASKISSDFPRLLCVAPMMGRTDLFMRDFLRTISPNLVLFTEMITAQALIYASNTSRFLRFPARQHPLVLQLGGGEPEMLKKAAHIAIDYGYDEINLNIGCPSSRVGKGNFGACLFKTPERVADCIYALKQAFDGPVSIKTRIGVDDMDSQEHLHDFVGRTGEAGCNLFYIHARKAFLKGLSPKENRAIPPLNYEFVYRLKQSFPENQIILNGGIETVQEGLAHLEKTDGIMVGRAFCRNPWLVSALAKKIYGRDATKERDDIARALASFIDTVPPSRRFMGLRPWTGLFYQTPGARRWRQLVENLARAKTSGGEALAPIEAFLAGFFEQNR